MYMYMLLHMHYQWQWPTCRLIPEQLSFNPLSFIQVYEACNQNTPEGNINQYFRILLQLPFDDM